MDYMYLNGFLTGLLPFIIVIPLWSQHKNVRVADGQQGAVLAAPAIAVNPRDPENIVAAFFPGKLYYSRDGGNSWNEAQLPGPSQPAYSPVVMAGRKGDFYCFRMAAMNVDDNGESGSVERVAYHLSEDGGVTWSAAIPAGPSQPMNQSDEWATLDGKGTLYVTWAAVGEQGGSNVTCPSEIFFSMSKNGKKWSDPVTIGKLSAPCDARTAAPTAMPAVTTDGKVFASWADGENIVVDRSFDGGERWLSNDIEVADFGDNGRADIPGHGPCAGTPVFLTDMSEGHYGRSLYLVWADQRSGDNDTDIWFTRSHNFGDNWSSPMRVNDDGAGKHQYLPWMAVDPETGYLYIVYYDRRDHEDTKTDVYLAYSTDGGTSFSNVRISTSAFLPAGTPTHHKLTHIAAYDGVITPVWTRTDDGRMSIWTTTIKHADLGK